MTLATAITRTRKKARENTESNLGIVEWINEGQKEFAKEVHGLIKEDYLTLEPRFDIQTHFAINLTIVGGTNALASTDIPICAADATDQTGTDVATALQVAIRAAGAATAAVYFGIVGSHIWQFQIDAIDSTSITLAPPSDIIYADALELLGFVAGTTTDTEVYGSIPTDCNLEVDLPTDFLSIVSDPEWNGDPLRQAPFYNFISPETSGTPTWYYIRDNKTIRLYPPPINQGMLHIFYQYIPEDFTVPNGYQECGLSGKADDTATGLAVTTQYYFKVNIDGGGVVEYDITTGTSVTYKDVIELMNDEVVGATFSLEGGDLRCTSDQLSASSSIALSAGTTGTDLFATLTGWTAFEDAVATEAGTSLAIDDEYAMAVVYYAASMLAENNFEAGIADRYLAQFNRIAEKYIIKKANNNTAFLPKNKVQRFPRVVM